MTSAAPEPSHASTPRAAAAKTAGMFLDAGEPSPPPPRRRREPPPRRARAKRDEDVLLALIGIALAAFVLAPFCGETLWDAIGGLL